VTQQDSGAPSAQAIIYLARAIWQKFEDKITPPVKEVA